MLDRLSAQKRNIALAVIAILVLWFSWTVRTVLNPLILGYLVAFIIHPMVQKLELRGWKRRSAVNVIFAAAAIVITLVTLGLVVQGVGLARSLGDDNQRLGDLETDIEDFVNERPSLLKLMPDWMLEDVKPVEVQSTEGAGAEEEPPRRLDLTWASVLKQAGKRTREAWDDGGWARAEQGLALLEGWIGSAVGLAMLLILLPIYSYFLLFELGRIHTFVHRYTPVRERERIARVSTKIGEVIANFFRGRLAVCFLKGLLLTVGLAICDVDRALLFGMTSGFAALIPFVGPLIGWLFAFVFTLLDPDFTLLGALLSTGIVFAIAEVIEGYVLVPKILGDSLGLHPVVVLVAVFIGGAALGMFGFLIALPLAAVVVILTREYVLPALADFADEGEEGGGVEPDGEGSR